MRALMLCLSLFAKLYAEYITFICIHNSFALCHIAMQVVDNGKGISCDDLKLVGERYATSKCHALEDLNHLEFFGFRGEALASIIDVSGTVELCSRHALSRDTYCKVFHNGKALGVSLSRNHRSSLGTTVTVHDFFYNLPVRRKGISDILELEKVRKAVECIALVNPTISFSVRNDKFEKCILQTHKSQSVLSSFGHIFGNEKALAMKGVLVTEGCFKVSGFISTEGHHNKMLQFMYINGRVVKNTPLHDYVNSLLANSMIARKLSRQNDPKWQSKESFGGKDLLSPKRTQEKYGMFVLMIECPRSEYDICLEPAKTLVEFKQWDKIQNTLESLVKAFLVDNNLSLGPVAVSTSSQKEDIAKTIVHSASQSSSQSLSNVPPPHISKFSGSRVTFDLDLPGTIRSRTVRQSKTTNDNTGQKATIASSQNFPCEEAEGAPIQGSNASSSLLSSMTGYEADYSDSCTVGSVHLSSQPTACLQSDGPGSDSHISISEVIGERTLQKYPLQHSYLAVNRENSQNALQAFTTGGKHAYKMESDTTILYTTATRCSVLNPSSLPPQCIQEPPTQIPYSQSRLQPVSQSAFGHEPLFARCHSTEVDVSSFRHKASVCAMSSSGGILASSRPGPLFWNPFDSSRTTDLDSVCESVNSSSRSSTISSLPSQTEVNSNVTNSATVSVSNLQKETLSRPLVGLDTPLRSPLQSCNLSSKLAKLIHKSKSAHISKQKSPKQAGALMSTQRSGVTPLTQTLVAAGKPLHESTPVCTCTDTLQGSPGGLMNTVCTSFDVPSARQDFSQSLPLYGFQLPGASQRVLNSLPNATIKGRVYESSYYKPTAADSSNVNRSRCSTFSLLSSEHSASSEHCAESCDGAVTDECQHGLHGWSRRHTYHQSSMSCENLTGPVQVNTSVYSQLHGSHELLQHSYQPRYPRNFPQRNTTVPVSTSAPQSEMKARSMLGTAPTGSILAAGQEASSLTTAHHQPTVVDLSMSAVCSSNLYLSDSGIGTSILQPSLEQTAEVHTTSTFRHLLTHSMSSVDHSQAYLQERFTDQDSGQFSLSTVPVEHPVHSQPECVHLGSQQLALTQLEASGECKSSRNSRLSSTSDNLYVYSISTTESTRSQDQYSLDYGHSQLSVSNMSQWKETIDPATGRRVYMHRSTGKCTTEKPASLMEEYTSCTETEGMPLQNNCSTDISLGVNLTATDSMNNSTDSCGSTSNAQAHHNVSTLGAKPLRAAPHLSHDFSSFLPRPKHQRVLSTRLSSTPSSPEGETATSSVVRGFLNKHAEQKSGCGNEADSKWRHDFELKQLEQTQYQSSHDETCSVATLLEGWENPTFQAGHEVCAIVHREIKITYMHAAYHQDLFKLPETDRLFYHSLYTQLCILIIQDILNIEYSGCRREQIRVHRVINQYKFSKEMFQNIKVRLATVYFPPWFTILPIHAYRYTYMQSKH